MIAPEKVPLNFERCQYPYGSDAILSLLPPHAQRLLDFGCSRGVFLSGVHHIPELFGCDIDAEAVDCARRSFPNGTFCKIGIDPRTPFLDSSFDAVTLLSVLEHVPDERALLAELHRIFKPSGSIIILVPHKGLFSFAAPGNSEFRFLRLHKRIHLHFGRSTEAAYCKDFGGAEGIVGCHSNRWHVYYSAQELKALLEGSFRSNIDSHSVYLSHPHGR